MARENRQRAKEAREAVETSDDDGKASSAVLLTMGDGSSTSCLLLNNTMTAVESMKVNLYFIHCNNFMLECISFTWHSGL